jgi:hypothetical protein
MPSFRRAKAAPTTTSVFSETLKQLSDKRKSLPPRLSPVLLPLCLQACQPTWKAYAKQVIANARTLGRVNWSHTGTSCKRMEPITISCCGTSVR